MATAQAAGAVMVETRELCSATSVVASRLFPSLLAAAVAKAALAVQTCRTVAGMEVIGQEVALQAAMPGGATVQVILPVGVTLQATREPIIQVVIATTIGMQAAMEQTMAAVMLMAVVAAFEDNPVTQVRTSSGVTAVGVVVGVVVVTITPEVAVVAGRQVVCIMPAAAREEEEEAAAATRVEVVAAVETATGTLAVPVVVVGHRTVSAVASMPGLTVTPATVGLPLCPLALRVRLVR